MKLPNVTNHTVFEVTQYPVQQDFYLKQPLQMSLSLKSNFLLHTGRRKVKYCCILLLHQYSSWSYVQPRLTKYTCIMLNQV